MTFTGKYRRKEKQQTSTALVCTFGWLLSVLRQKTDRQTDRQTKTEIDRDRNRKREAQTDRKSEGEKEGEKF